MDYPFNAFNTRFFAKLTQYGSLARLLPLLPNKKSHKWTENRYLWLISAIKVRCFLIFNQGLYFGQFNAIFFFFFAGCRRNRRALRAK